MKVIQPVRGKHIFYLIGVNGSGKSTYMSQQLPAGYLVFDRSPHMQAIQHGVRKYYNDTTAIADAMFWAGVHTALKRGVSFAICKDFDTRAGRRMIIAPARNAGYRLTCVLFCTPPDVCLRRIKQDPSRSKTTRWRELITNWMKRYEAPTEDEYDECIQVLPCSTLT